MLNIDRNKRYLLACSYGPDSMALFYLLEKEKIDFAVAHVNYNLRSESAQEMNDLKAYCKAHNKQLFILENKENLGTNNLEEKCRKIRYHFFEEIIKENGFESLLVAHHQDDILETYLLQKKRKNIVKCYGISEISYIFGIKVIRPLLSFSKKDLLELCLKNNVPFSIDKTNLENHFERNKIRHQIIDKIDDKKRANLLNEIDMQNQKLSTIKNDINKLDIHSQSDLQKLDEIHFAFAMFSLLDVQGTHLSLSHKLLKELNAIVLSNKSNVVFPINKGVEFHCEYGRIFFSNSSKVDYLFIVEKPSILDNQYFFLDFTKDASNRNVKNTDYPLTIRPYKSGDTYLIKDYSCKVNRLYIDWKMPISLRKRWPIIINKDGKIIYIPRYRSDFIRTSNLNFYVK